MYFPFIFGRHATGKDEVENENLYIPCDAHVNTVTSLSEFRMTFPNELVKGKAVPLQAWTGPEDSRKLRFPEFVTTAQDGGKVVSFTLWPPLPPGKTLGTHFC